MCDAVGIGEARHNPVNLRAGNVEANYAKGKELAAEIRHR